MTNLEILKQIHSGLIVSCQALEDEPLHSSFIMGRMAFAAFQGGAVGIRANTPEDITEIKRQVPLPVIGIVKRDFPDSPVRITPTMEEVRALADCGAEIIASDATSRLRPGGVSLDEFFQEARREFPNQLFMADCATLEEARHAEQLGFDLVGTTLRGYTADTEGITIPDYPLLRQLAQELSCPVIAEGGIWSPEQLRQAIGCGVHACVVGTAITRPREITRRYADALR